MKNKSLITLIAVSLLLFIGLIFSVYKVTTKKEETFYTKGYISLSDLTSSKKVYFNEGTNYKRGYSKQVIFKDTENVKQEVSKYSFVFYGDKSINYLNDGVLMDLDGISGNFIPYYNIKSNYLIQYKDGKYVIDGQNKDIVLNSFIGRINEQKYLVAGNNLKLKVGSSEEMISGYYFELNFGEGNVVKIDNADISIETVSDECYIMVGNDIKIDLSEKNIYYKDEIKANLAEVIIDNDSNIDIQYKEKTDEGNGDSGEGNEDEGNTTPAIPEPIDEYYTETVIEYKNVPYVEIISSNTSAHQVSLDFRVIDINNLITGTVKVRYTNMKSGYTEVKEYDNYQGIINYIIDNLPSNSDYLVTIYASYVREGNIYNDYRMFQRMYTTKTLGVTLVKDYVTSSEASYNVVFDNDANYESVAVSIYDKSGRKVDTKVVNRSSNPVPVVFDGLTSDEKYSVVVEQFNYGNFVYSSDDYIESVTTTLKKNPFKSAGIVVPDPIAIINKKDYIVKLSLGEIEDPNHAIKKVTYNIYNAADDSIVDTFEKDNITDEEIQIGDKIKAYINDVAQTYYFKATITLEDNEKELDYTTNKSNTFNIDAKISPTVTYESEVLTANTSRGKFIINDIDNTIDTTKSVYVEYVDSLGNKNTKMLSYGTCPAGQSMTTKCVDVYIDALNSDDIYTLSLWAYVDTKDHDLEPGTVQIGAIKIATEKADIILADISSRDLEIEEATEKIFELSIGLSLDEMTNEAVRDNMSSFDIYLYEGADITGTYLSSIHVEGNSEIINNYFNQKKIITLSDFNITIDEIRNMHLAEGTQMTKRFTVRLTNGVSGSDYVEFKPNTYTFEINSALLDILNGNCEIEVTPILNGSLPSNKQDHNLDEGTVVGLKVTPSFSNKYYAKKINFYIVDVTMDYDVYGLDVTSHIDVSYALDLLESSTIPEYEFYMTDEALYVSNHQFLKRGRVYRVLYTLELDLNNDGQTDLVYPFSSTDVSTPEPVVSEKVEIPRQEPSLMIFPWESDGSSITYKYSAVDPDNSLGNDYNVSYMVDSEKDVASKVTCANPAGVSGYTSNYGCMKISNLHAGDEYTVFVMPTLIDRQDPIELEINNYKFEGVHNLNDLGYEIVKDTNNNPKYDNILALKINDSSSDHALNRVAYYTATLSIPEGKSFTIDNINDSTSLSPLSSNMITYSDGTDTIVWNSTSSDTSLSKVAYVSKCDDDENTCLYIDYSKLYLSSKYKDYFMPFRNKTITISLSATYDSGVVGYRVKQALQKYAVQIVASEDVLFNGEIINNRYFILNYNNVNTGSINLNDSALSGVYLYDIAENGFVDDKTIDNTVGSGKIYFINSIYSNFKNIKNRNYVNLDYKVNHQGIMVTIGNAPGTMVPVVIKELSTSTFGTSLTYSFERIVPTLNVSLSTPTLNGVKLNMNLTGITENEIQTESGNKYVYLEVYDENSQKVKEVNVNINNLTVQTGSINNNEFVISGDADYKFDLVTVKASASVIDSSMYSYDYKTGKIVFKDAAHGGVDYPNGTNIEVTYRIVLDNLVHNTNYTLKAYVKMEGVSNKVYLAGNNNTYQTLEHNFTTKDTVGVRISDAKYEIESDIDYATRRLVTSYNIEDIVGINNLVYEICNANDLCVDVTKYSNCSNDYNHFDGSCFEKANGYRTIVKHDISIENNFDFEFSTEYTLKIKAVITENNTENTYDIYNSSLPVRKLEMPTISVDKQSHFDNYGVPYLTFDVTFNDPDRVVSIPQNGTDPGTYAVYLAYGAEKVKITGSDKIEDVIKNNAINTAHIRYDNLNKLTEYYLIVEYNTHANNNGETVNKFYSIPYLIYTLDDNGVSIGKLEYQAEKLKTILKFGYATNILEEKILDEHNELIDDPNQEAYVAGINYSITRKSGDNQFRMNGNIIFNDNSHIAIKEDDSSLGDKYYELTINHGVDDTYTGGYPVTAGYNIVFKFYLGGNIAKDLNTEGLCLDNNVSNVWDAELSKCYILDIKSYNADTIYGG